MTVGSMSLGVLFTYLGMLIPTLFGIIVYKQSITVLQVIGLVLMVATLFLGAGIKKGEKINIKWLVYAFSSLVMWGMVGVIQQIYQNSEYSGEMNTFLQITDKPTIFRWVFVIHIKFLIFVDKKCKSLLQRIFAIFFMFCTAAVSKHCSETLSFPRIRQ